MATYSCPACHTQLPDPPASSAFDPVSEIVLLVVGYLVFNLIEEVLRGVGLSYWLAFVVAMAPFAALAGYLRWRRARARCVRCRALVPYAKARTSGAARVS